MKNFSLAIGTVALVAVLAGCSGSNAGSQLPSPGAMQLTAFHRSDGTQRDSYSGKSRWQIYNYCASSSEICPGSTSDFYNLVTFYLKPTRYTALLVTKNPTLTGDLTSVTLTDQVNVTHNGKTAKYGDFVYQGEPSCSGGPAASARFFFTSGGLFQYTHYWWSDSVSWTLAQQPSSSTISQAVNVPSAWSDWNGQPGTANPKKFAGAIKNVTMVGLSFGGGCFFENGVTVTGPKNAIFNSTFTE